ncbi:hypothetical protein DIS24_g11371 [Lasiodiplodia hormozganensis]|uniref:Uncharacterized protein n=1 Tax=Lasiodiplodia hormozganensis TaxID=869390 RepID=A0AA40C221_9PEZI|nr:hypothetical protein DIS24_g11371 [Lasiodiplodia hormozganensis]
MPAAPILPPMPAKDFNAPPAHGTRAAAARKAVRIFNTTSGPLYGIGEDDEEAEADVTQTHERLEAHAAAEALQKLSQDTSYTTPPPEIAAAMDRQRKRQGGIFTPVSFLPPDSEDKETGLESEKEAEIATEETTEPEDVPAPPRTPFANTLAGGHLPPALVGPRARVELPRPELPRPGPTRPFTGLSRPRVGQPNLAPRGGGNNGRGPSTPRAKYYTNPHHGPSRYGGWFEHVRGTPYGISDTPTPRRVLPPPREYVWPHEKGFGVINEPVIPPKPQEPGPSEEDDGSEWCAVPSPEMNQRVETDAEKRVDPDVHILRPQPLFVLLSEQPSMPTAGSSTRTKRMITTSTTPHHDNDTSVKQHRSSISSYSNGNLNNDSFTNDILYARELFGGSLMHDFR